MGIICSLLVNPRRRQYRFPTDRTSIVPLTHSPILLTFNKAKKMMLLELLPFLDLPEIVKLTLLNK